MGCQQYLSHCTKGALFSTSHPHTHKKSERPSTERLCNGFELHNPLPTLLNSLCLMAVTISAFLVGARVEDDVAEQCQYTLKILSWICLGKFCCSCWQAGTADMDSSVQKPVQDVGYQLGTTLSAIIAVSCIRSEVYTCILFL